MAAEQAAVFQKEQAALQSDLDAATQELERLQQEQSAAAERSSPTDAEQVQSSLRFPVPHSCIQAFCDRLQPPILLQKGNC